MVLAERFGWTWDELDEQDMSRVIPAVAASNIHAAVRRVHHWLEEAPKALAKKYELPQPSDDDMRTWTMVKQAQKDVAHS